MTKVGLDTLKVYQYAERGSIEVYNITKLFPPGEWFRGRSVDQLRRSSESVANNIAEGYSRNSAKDKLRIFQDIVRGEAEETKRGLIRSLKKGFAPESGLQPVIDTYTELLKTLHGYIRYIKTSSCLPTH
jgi:four helix bundle protein